jgi:flagellar biogenesis protein FliO
MGIARLQSIIVIAGVLTLIAVGAVGAASVAPPSSELNGVATITEVIPLEPGAIAEGARLVTPREPVDSIDIDEVAAPPLPLVQGDESFTPINAESLTADVLGEAGAASSFDRRPIFGADSETSVAIGETGPISPAGTTAWWNAPELRVFGLLSLLVIAAVCMRRFGGRAIGLAGGPRPSGVVSVLGRFPFGRSASLVLLECGPKVLLLHQQAGKGGAVSTLSEFANRDEVAELRRQLNANERDAKDGFGRDLEQSLGLYDRGGQPKGFNGDEGLPIQGPIETVDLTRRRPRRGVRGN